MAVHGRQQGAEIVFQRADLPAQYRLRDVRLLGGAAEVQLLGYGDEVPQLAQVQIQGASRSGDASRVSPLLKEVLDSNCGRPRPWNRA